MVQHLQRARRQLDRAESASGTCKIVIVRGRRQRATPPTREPLRIEWFAQAALHGSLVSVSNPVSTRSWLTVPDLVEMLGMNPGRVHRMFEDHQLLATRIDGVLKVPADFLVDGQPLTGLRGTAILLLDSGFSSDEAIEWLLNVDDSIGVAPIDALRAGRKAEVRRVAQALA